MTTSGANVPKGRRRYAPSGTSAAPNAFKLFLARIRRAILIFLGRSKRGTRPRAGLDLEPLEERVTPAYSISTVPYVISVPGIYQLESNLYYGDVQGNAITVEADGVVIDLHGYRLWSATGTTTTAAGVGSTQRSSITVENGTIEGFQFGIRLWGENGSGNQVRDMALVNNLYVAIWVDGRGTVVANNSVENTGGSSLSAYTIPIGVHVSGANSLVVQNRIKGLVWYPGVTEEVVGLALDDAPSVVVAGNTISQQQYSDNSWGMWVDSVDGDVATTVDLENNYFANFQCASAFINAPARIKDNLYSNVSFWWFGSGPDAQVDLGGNVALRAFDIAPEFESAPATVLQLFQTMTQTAAKDESVVSAVFPEALQGDPRVFLGMLSSMGDMTDQIRPAPNSARLAIVEAAPLVASAGTSILPAGALLFRSPLIAMEPAPDVLAGCVLAMAHPSSVALGEQRFFLDKEYSNYLMQSERASVFSAAPLPSLYPTESPLAYSLTPGWADWIDLTDQAPDAMSTVGAGALDGAASSLPTSSPPEWLGRANGTPCQHLTFLLGLLLMEWTHRRALAQAADLAKTRHCWLQTE